MRNITLKLKNLKDPEKMDVITYTNVHDGYPNDGFFKIFTKDKARDNWNKDYDSHYYPMHLILKVESEFTKLHCFEPMTVDRKTISIYDLTENEY